MRTISDANFGRVVRILQAVKDGAQPPTPEMRRRASILLKKNKQK